MTFSELLSLLFAMACVVAIATVLGVVGPALDEEPWKQEIARREFRRDLQAAQFCREMNRNSSFQWAASGELVCIPR